MMTNQLIKTGSIDLYTESFGNKSNPAIVLIAGAMAPARFWNNTFCEELSAAGYLVIRYDHRDMGFSSAVDFTKSPYALNDLTKDVIAILDGYHIEQAHLVGHSMGGAIAQLAALDYPDRVASITLISSSVLTPIIFTRDEEASLGKTWQIMMRNKPTSSFAKSVGGFMESLAYLHGKIPMDNALAEAYIKDMYERSKPEHIAWFERFSAGIEPLHNHVKAQQSITDRTQELNKITIPVLIIHGQLDNLAFLRIITEYAADLIPQSQLIVIPEMGHMLLDRTLFTTIQETLLRFVHNKTGPHST